MITEHTTVTYFRTYLDAAKVAYQNQIEDLGQKDGWSYRVEFHAGRQAYFVAVFDENDERLGPL